MPTRAFIYPYCALSSDILELCQTAAMRPLREHAPTAHIASVFAGANNSSHTWGTLADDDDDDNDVYNDNSDYSDYSDSDGSDSEYSDSDDSDAPMFPPTSSRARTKRSVASSSSHRPGSSSSGPSAPREVRPLNMEDLRVATRRLLETHAEVAAAQSRRRTPSARWMADEKDAHPAASKQGRGDRKSDPSDEQMAAWFRAALLASAADEESMSDEQMAARIRAAFHVSPADAGHAGGPTSNSDPAKPKKGAHVERVPL